MNLGALIPRLASSILFVVAVSFAAASQVRPPTALVKIDPPKATVFVGETQTFKALAGGTKSTGTKWSIQEPNGGRITDDGVYTAPQAIGIYHIVASSTTNSRERTTAIVTVVEHYDVPASMK